MNLEIAIDILERHAETEIDPAFVEAMQLGAHALKKMIELEKLIERYRDDAGSDGVL